VRDGLVDHWKTPGSRIASSYGGARGPSTNRSTHAARRAPAPNARANSAAS
jgi:hypothetical protein